MILDFFQMHNQFYQYYLLSTVLSPVICSAAFETYQTSQMCGSVSNFSK